MTSQMTRQTAATNCKIDGDVLVSISNPYEQAFIDVLLNDYGENELFWIGLNRVQVSGTLSVVWCKVFLVQMAIF